MAEAGSERDAMAAKLEAERVAREAEETRKREIMAKIRLLEQEKAECQELKSAFSGMKSRLAGIISQINGLKGMRLETDIHSFSGIAANAVNAGILDAQINMGKRNSSFSNIESAIGMQIGLLSSYIIELEGRINTLRASL